MDSDAWSDADEAELNAWLETDGRRRGALLQAQAAWTSLDLLAPAQPQPLAPSLAQSRRRLVQGGLVAASALALAGWSWLRSGTEYSTGVGEIRRLPLADGSVVEINTVSKVAIDFNETRRTVRLETGEAWFQVAKDVERPFFVEAGGARAVAVGTAFAVRKLSRGTEIMVTEGVVEAWATTTDHRKIRLLAGERIFIDERAGPARSASASTSIERSLAWRGGRIDLAGDTLSDAIAEFNRYNRRKIVLSDPRLASEQFDGLFRVDDPEGFAVAVKDSLSVPIDLSTPQQIRIGGPIE